MQHGLVFCELVKAYFDCRRYKRNKLTSLDFEFALESSLCRLYDELISGKYKIGPSVCFVILNPKPREVWAANFRDRIVHLNAIIGLLYLTHTVVSQSVGQLMLLRHCKSIYRTRRVIFQIMFII